MTPVVTEALLWRGITPPPYGSNRTTCPKCSHKRRKKGEKCLSINVTTHWIDWRCFHCRYTDGEVL
jgi:hypothetical protein